MNEFKIKIKPREEHSEKHPVSIIINVFGRITDFRN
jgi:hypothetical protein